MPILGICNGFQVLCEVGLLPGALTRNEGLHFVCRDPWLKVENAGTAWSSRYEQDAEILITVKNAEGRLQASQSVLDELEGEGRVRSILANGHAPTPRPAGDALVVALPAVPTRSLADYAIAPSGDAS